MIGTILVVILVLLLLGALPISAGGEAAVGIPRAVVPPSGLMSPLRHFVGSVILGCAEKKMLRIAATTVIASVQNEEVLRYRPFRHFPGKPMSAMQRAAIHQLPITSIIETSLPIPTFIFWSYLYTGPKLLGNRHLLSEFRGICARLRAICAASELGEIFKPAVDSLSDESPAAGTTDARHLSLGIGASSLRSVI